MFSRILILPSLLALSACSSSSPGHGTAPHETPPAPKRVGSTRGGAVVMTRDERIAVVANRSAGVVTVFQLDPKKPLEERVQPGPTEIDIDASPLRDATELGSEPWAAVIGADDDTAYVITRRDQQVLRIDSLHEHPHLDVISVSAGSEPTAIAITPSGARLFVANWGEGTISVITTADFAARGKIDLNAALAGTGRLGDVSNGIAMYSSARPALAHPRALAITDNGDEDDGDETLYATEFFSQPGLEAEDPADLMRFDRNREGLVYPVPLTKSAAVSDPIPLGAVTDTGFPDAKGHATGCFPNQLYAAAADGGQLFVTSMCASPMGPVGPFTNPDKSSNPANFKTAVHPSVFVVDRRTGAEHPATDVLTHVLDQEYSADAADQRRMPLIPNDIAFVGSGGSGESRTACLTAMGADAVFCLDYDTHGSLRGVGSSGARFIDLHTAPFRYGIRPVGIAVSSGGTSPFALVVNDGSQNLSVIDLSSNSVKAVQATTTDKTPHALVTRASSANQGRTFFATGLDLWSFKGQAWNSCESCHPDGLSDGITWFFTRGPRRTISTAGTYDQNAQRRLMLWTGNTDEVHDVEAIARSVAGGTGAILQNDYATPSNDLRIVYDGKVVVPPQKPTSTLRNNLNGSLAELLTPQSCDPTAAHCDSTPISDWDGIDAFIRSVRAPRQPSELDGDQVALGRSVFQKALCTGCHGGLDWTLSRVFYTPGSEQNGNLPYEKPAALDPAQLGVLRTTPYTVPAEMMALGLNPPAQSGTAPLRHWIEGDVDTTYSDATALNDQINCALRAVGTFPAQPGADSGLPPDTNGVIPKGAPSVPEIRQDPSQEMSLLSLGGTGFNIPSLVGVAAGAPYFHAGNARTLEEAFDVVFSAHHRAFGDKYGQFAATPADIRALVAFLLSIDDDSDSEDVPSGKTADLPFNPDLCPLPTDK